MLPWHRTPASCLHHEQLLTSSPGGKLSDLWGNFLHGKVSLAGGFQANFLRKWKRGEAAENAALQTFPQQYVIAEH